MVAAKSVRIDPNVLKVSSTSGIAGQARGSGGGDFMSALSGFSGLFAEGAYQATGNTNAAAVLHSAFSALPAAYGAGPGAGGGYSGSILGGNPGIMGAASHGTGLDPYGYGGGGGAGGAIPGMDGTDQASLINQMNSNNLQLLELQAVMQNNMQQWTTKSNVLKSVHDAKMAMIQHFAVRG
jgi:hypothetical protein